MLDGKLIGQGGPTGLKKEVMSATHPPLHTCFQCKCLPLVHLEGPGRRAKPKASPSQTGFALSRGPSRRTTSHVINRPMKLICGSGFFHLCGYQLYPLPSLPGQQPGSSRDLPEDLQNIVSLQTRDLAWAYARRYLLLQDWKSTPGFTPGQMSAYAGILTKGAQGYGAGTYPRIYKKNVPRSPRQYPGFTWLGCHQVQN